VRLAVEQQRSHLHYWSKHKNALELLGIKCILILHHAARYLLLRALSFVRFQKSSIANDRRRASWACLHELVCGREEPRHGQGFWRSAR
jgi:hypothetical protein